MQVVLPWPDDDDDNAGWNERMPQRTCWIRLLLSNWSDNCDLDYDVDYDVHEDDVDIDDYDIDEDDCDDDVDQVRRAKKTTCKGMRGTRYALYIIRGP